MLRATTALLALALGCAAPRVGKVRFHNRPAVWAVDDRRDVREKPEPTRELDLWRAFDANVYLPVYRGLALADRDRVRAFGVNALGGVPDSTWFTNRIGRRPMTPDELRRGPTDHRGPPDLSAPLAVVSRKPTGVQVGYIVEDRRGVRYIIKFETRDHPDLQSANHVPVQRLLWAAGYNVPNDGIAVLRRDQLISRDPQIDAARIDRDLASVAREPSGGYRILYSEFLPGKPNGGFEPHGTRADDPNDTIPHELRRELRGLGLLSSWLQHTDLRMFNTLDMWTEDPERPGRHYVVHYLLDFGKSLGVFVKTNRRHDDNHATLFDRHVLKSALAFGLWKRPWEDVRDPGIPAVGTFDVETYRPGDSTPHSPYWPFVVADRFDNLWAVDIMLELTEAHIRAALETGRYPDPRAVDYLARVLVGRQRKAARYWLARVNPLVDPELSDGALCVTDLWVAHRLGAEVSRYRAESFGYGGEPLGWSVSLAHRDGRVCARGFGPGPTEGGYTIVRFDTWRGDRRLDPVEIHLAKTPGGGALRVIGINRR